MNCPFDEVEGRLIKEEGVRFDTAYGIDCKKILMF
jgi:hypothetical protein